MLQKESERKRQSSGHSLALYWLYYTGSVSNSWKHCDIRKGLFILTRAHCYNNTAVQMCRTGISIVCWVQLKCDSTRWCTGGKWRGNWQVDWLASTLLTTSECGVSSITTADAHISAASSQMNWHAHIFKWTRLFHRKTKSGFCVCAITFQTQSMSCDQQICMHVQVCANAYIHTHATH